MAHQGVPKPFRVLRVPGIVPQGGATEYADPLHLTLPLVFECHARRDPATINTMPEILTTVGEKTFLEANIGPIVILVLFAILVATLMVIVPQLLRANLRKVELQHAENLKALEQGLGINPGDERSRVAGRTAMLVPMVSICAAATVTCFLVAYRSTDIFTISLAVWVVAGVVSLAAITGGVALIGRLAQLQSADKEQPIADNPLDPERRHSVMR